MTVLTLELNRAIFTSLFGELTNNYYANVHEHHQGAL